MFVALATAALGALAAEPVPDPPAAVARHDARRVQTFVPKRSLKIHHVEVLAHAGTVVGDPFVVRRLAGATVAYHVSEIAGLSSTVQFSPDLGELDWTPTTRQLLDQNQVAPELSRILLVTTGDFQFAPIYGKVAAGDRIVRFDLYGTVGIGALLTRDDLALSDLQGEPIAADTEVQWHPGLGAGGGLRVWLGRHTAARLDVRSHSYIEVIDGTALTMKNVAAVTAGLSMLVCAASDKEQCQPRPPPRAGRH